MSYQFFIGMSIFGWAIGAMMYKPAALAMHPIMVSAVSTALYVTVLPFVLTFGSFNKTVTSTGIVFSLLGATFNCLGSLGYFFSLRAGGGAGVSAILTGLYPALTIILSYLFLGETFSIKKGIGIGLALLSFTILSQK